MDGHGAVTRREGKGCRAHGDGQQQCQPFLLTPLYKGLTLLQVTVQITLRTASAQCPSCWPRHCGCLERVRNGSHCWEMRVLNRTAPAPTLHSLARSLTHLLYGLLLACSLQHSATPNRREQAVPGPEAVDSIDSCCVTPVLILVAERGAGRHPVSGRQRRRWGRCRSGGHLCATGRLTSWRRRRWRRTSSWWWRRWRRTSSWWRWRWRWAGSWRRWRRRWPAKGRQASWWRRRSSSRNHSLPAFSRDAIRRVDDRPAPRSRGWSGDRWRWRRPAPLALVPTLWKNHVKRVAEHDVHTVGAAAAAAAGVLRYHPRHGRTALRARVLAREPRAGAGLAVRVAAR